MLYFYKPSPRSRCELVRVAKFDVRTLILQMPTLGNKRSPCTPLCVTPGREILVVHPCATHVSSCLRTVRSISRTQVSAWRHPLTSVFLHVLGLLQFFPVAWCTRSAVLLMSSRVKMRDGSPNELCLPRRHHDLAQLREGACADKEMVAVRWQYDPLQGRRFLRPASSYSASACLQIIRATRAKLHDR